MIMIDIWGRPISAGATNEPQDVKKIIEDEIAETLNLTSVDPNEIVVFQDRQGRLKSSNVSLDDLLTRNLTAVNNTIALFQDGKLKPGVLVSTIIDNLAAIKPTTDNIAALRSEYDTHVGLFVTLRTNFNRTDDAVGKFFGKKNVKPGDVKTTLAEITNGIEMIRGSINTQSLGIDANGGKLNKLKIPHPAENIVNVVYVVASGTLEWVQTTNNRVTFTPTVAGIYRFTTASNKHFNIIASGVIGIPQSWATVVNTVAARVDANIVWTFTIVSSTDTTVLRGSIPWVIEFVSN